MGLDELIISHEAKTKYVFLLSSKFKTGRVGRKMYSNSLLWKKKKKKDLFSKRLILLFDVQHCNIGIFECLHYILVAPLSGRHFSGYTEDRW